MILTAIIYDLRSSKIVASSTFTNQPYSENLLQKALNNYYLLLESGSDELFTTVTDDSESAMICRVNELNILIGFGPTSRISDIDRERIKSLAEELGTIVDDQAFRQARRDFDKHFHKAFSIDAFFCFFSSTNPLTSDKTGFAVAKIIEHRHNPGFPFTKPMDIGPYKISIMRKSSEEIPNQNWSVYLQKIDVFGIIISEEQTPMDELSTLVSKIRSNSSAKILVIPSSDDFLEAAREIESSLELLLCDSVVATPSYLLVSMLATSGRLDIHPELAMETLVISKEADKPINQIQTETDTIGHQAFFVIDQLQGESMFEYYYTDEPRVSRNISNVIAAVSMFKLDNTLPTTTSVFQSGNLKYAILERDGLLFTLITGQTEDAESLRTKFASLPDLYLESKPPKIENPDDLYSFPPFTLKLLATVPPDEWLREMVPSRRKAPDWKRFESKWMREFLKTVWMSVDGSKTISDLQTKEGSGLVIGALHFLKRMDAIEKKLRISPEYIPVLIGEVDNTIKTLYSGLDKVLDSIDGQHTIRGIATDCGIDQNVMVTVFIELRKRGVVKFKT